MTKETLMELSDLAEELRTFIERGRLLSGDLVDYFGYSPKEKRDRDCILCGYEIAVTRNEITLDYLARAAKKAKKLCDLIDSIPMEHCRAGGVNNERTKSEP